MVGAGMLRYSITFLPSDSMFASEVCGPGGTRYQSIQINQRRQIDLRQALGHAAADHRVNHPSRDSNDYARRT